MVRFDGARLRFFEETGGCAEVERVVRERLVFAFEEEAIVLSHDWMTRRILMMAGKIVRGSERKSIVRVKEAYGSCLA